MPSNRSVLCVRDDIVVRRGVIGWRSFASNFRRGRRQQPSREIYRRGAGGGRCYVFFARNAHVFVIFQCPDDSAASARVRLAPIEKTEIRRYVPVAAGVCRTWHVETRSEEKVRALGCACLAPQQHGSLYQRKARGILSPPVASIVARFVARCSRKNDRFSRAAANLFCSLTATSVIFVLPP